MSDVLSVLIVGCGDIAGGYDERAHDGGTRTHAGAYAADGRFEMRACVDPDAERREAFMAYWNVAAGYPDLESCLTAEGAFDVASICVPTAYHADALAQLLVADVRLVFAEKPLTDNVDESRRLVAEYAAAGRPLAVNFLRRWDRRVQQLRAEIRAGDWGAVQAVGGLYAKGLRNCGSHFFDIVQYLIGPMTPVHVLGQVDDGRDDDPTLSVALTLEGGRPVTLIGADADKFFPFEVDLVMDNGRISLEDLGGKLRLRRVRQHPEYVHQATLDDGEIETTGLAGAMVAAVGNIYEHLTEDAELESTGDSALVTEELTARILAMAGPGAN